MVFGPVNVGKFVDARTVHLRKGGYCRTKSSWGKDGMMVSADHFQKAVKGKSPGLPTPAFFPYDVRMPVLVLVAGTNEPSNSAVLAEAFSMGIADEGIAVEKLRLKDLSIEHFTLAHYDPSCPSGDDFCRIQDLLLSAKGLVIATPIWNFSVPAHLKNVIDRIGAVALDQQTRSRGQLKGLPVSFIFAGGAPLLAWRALMFLTTLSVTEAFKYYGATILGRHFEPRCMLGRGRFGLVVDRRPGSLQAMRRQGKRFGRIVKTYAQTGTLPARFQLQQKFFSFLYRVGNRIMYPIGKWQ
ncbi:MAG TPA: hypothetical protein DEB30_00790 [Candidatus Peribacter riflensis]|uniref:NADPH-dependent FMN reductase-like domain-containing protein n=1 Tax=Candidatus Peribacter riflensis TaxID=1735162 RepID=A0A0S1SAU0_9BACT|nr:MAG: hypothetical protein PeribacterA2_0266 [Candidatus Peribacter riflensis]OGJ82988.1 MAG: hypothetical protein A2412_05205 [Candidatus Peribacteria bacterium RIFOXYC1_FULL_58_8]ALM10760.1 MAG: hypothetical protein PeribacterB2_0266 [Candidatus Peribacter riflensis]ALM11862.1 MAG: hypothetical protein PeribacterC2_0265 [Candidatus Peribacter riflensis]ALM12965.1 MAG: hypothetical protein PeribacterD1_0266 [Candidatus Peribacter riflensis]